ncbi:NAD-dependent epimerase/dehydratase family protein [Planktomarina temperata]|nr:NAD-dependent epimerase/dehydratase family protein [Planktomarina temperata]
MEKIKSFKSHIVLPGGAGLVGQNLVVLLKARGYQNITVIDKHSRNTELLRCLHPDIEIIETDLSKAGEWKSAFFDAHTVVMLQAQIGGLCETEFVRNNIVSTRLVLSAIAENNVPNLIHVSSSVVNSIADDNYTRSKTEQERLVRESGCSATILRPTLMFGWFDRKHLGWLSRFMKKIPFFPIPGHGRYMRQPLYVGDFCKIIVSVITNGGPTGVFDITGRERIDYIDLIREVRRASKQKTPILKIPFFLFKFLLIIWGLFDKSPPFTTHQLEALVTKDDFNLIDWPDIFDVNATPLRIAMDETFSHPVYSEIVLEF